MGKTKKASTPEQKAKWTIANKKAYQKRRSNDLGLVGVSCECCETTIPEFLAVDHITGGGGKLRKAAGGGSNLIRGIVKSGEVTGLRVLCHNCNNATRYGRICPHKRSTILDASASDKRIDLK